VAIKGRPHGLNLGAGEAGALSGNHVTTAQHQIRMPKGHQGDRLIHLGVVVGGAVSTVQVADHHKSGIPTGRIVETIGASLGNHRLGGGGNSGDASGADADTVSAEDGADCPTGPDSGHWRAVLVQAKTRLTMQPMASPVKKRFQPIAFA
jgi:hypothetical protein